MKFGPLPALVVVLLSSACQQTGAGGCPEQTPGAGDKPRPTPGIEAFTQGMTRLPGFLTLYHDADADRLYLELEQLEVDLLYYVSLPAGLGSNPVGLDRGQLGDQRVVRFRPVGARLFLEVPNLAWRSSSTDPLERRAVAESFADGVLAAFEVVARSSERRLIEVTEFVLRDAHRIAATLQDTGQGEFQLDRKRSALWMEATRGFPDNTEVETLLTFAGSNPGYEVRQTAAEPRAVSLRVRHSFVRLPELSRSGYRPRAFDPRCGFHGTSWKDLTRPIDAPLLESVINRHRLERGGEPIVYYIDPAAPEPVRTALLEGARYWEPVFAQAGFPGGFRVELLPPGADAQDVRFNTVQWVHRSTRGWSYGMSVGDPRTGEILKGHVTLGALRVRQDVLLAEGLLSPYAGTLEHDARVQAMALARIRQLSAHEIGHTLGLVHNFAASASNRASVMDYPAPLVRVDPDGQLDLAFAYREGCGEWDELVIRYGYGMFDDEAAGLAGVLADMEASGIAFLSDADARGPDRAHPLANLWDNGADPVLELEHTLNVRRIALENLSARALQAGEPLARLEDVLVPAYFHHRYQLEAAVRQVGGVEYAHTVRGGARVPVRPVDDAQQRRALDVVLRTLEPEFLALPTELLAQLPPPAPGSDPAAERFDEDALLVDAEGAGASCVHLTLSLLLDPVRATRLVDQEAAEPGRLGLDDVLGRLLEQAWGAGAGRTAARTQVLDHLMTLSVDDAAPPRVQRTAHRTLQELQRRLRDGRAPAETYADGAQAAWELERIRRFLERGEVEGMRVRSYELPPGSPIGCASAGG